MANIERTIPFSWEAWDKQDELFHTYYDVEFLEDFGEFKKGSKFTLIDVDYGRGVIEVYGDNEGELEVIKRQEYKAMPI
jgi:hypothetical protein